MFEKLSFIEERYDELSRQISDPEVIADQAGFGGSCARSSPTSLQLWKNTENIKYVRNL